MTEPVPSEFAAALARGDVALWLAPSWTCPSDDTAQAALGKRDWLGVWAEGRDQEFAQVLAAMSGPTSKLLIEVPDRIEDILGERYSSPMSAHSFTYAALSPVRTS